MIAVKSRIRLELAESKNEIKKINDEIKEQINWISAMKPTPSGLTNRYSQVFI